MRPGIVWNKSKTLYCTAVNADGDYGLNTGSAVEAYAAGHWTSYAFPVTDPNGLGTYDRATIDLPDGVYRFDFYQQAGGGAATTDAPAVWTETKQLTGGVWVEASTAQQNADALLAATNGGATVGSQLQHLDADVSDAIGNAGTGDGDTPVNHNTGGTDVYRILDPDDNGVDNASLKAYLKSEYDADPTAATLRGETYTDSEGRWVAPLMLNAGLAYTVVVSAPGRFVAYTFDITP